MAISKVIYKSSANATPETWMDATTATAAAADITAPKTAMLADGVMTTGMGSGVENREDLCEAKDVDFIDFDGRLLYSYTAQEFLALDALPPNPSYPGLVAQGWNWTLSDAKAYVSEWGALVVGQSYITTDGRTRAYVHVTKAQTDANAVFTLCLYSITSGTGTVYWGDEATSTITSYTGVKALKHTYSSPGDYIIEIEINSGSFSIGGHQSHANIIDVPASSTNVGKVSLSLEKVEVGSNISGFGRQPFHGCYNLKSVSIPTSLTGFNDTANSDGSAFESVVMKGVVFPSGFQGKAVRMFEGCWSIRYISVPKSTTMLSIGTTATRSLHNLRKLTMYSLENTETSTIRIWYAKNYCTHVIIPGNYTTLAAGTVAGSLIRKFTIPQTVTTVQSEALIYNYYLEELHVLPTSVPTMGNTRALLGLNPNCIIYVPYSADHSILNAYQTATNWSTYASKMQEEPQ